MNGSITPTAVPLRRHMFPDEWSETYLASVVRSHGVRRPWGYDIDLVRDLLPGAHVQSVEALSNEVEPEASTYQHGRPQYGSLPFPSWASIARAMPLRYCPMCLVEARYTRTRWRISGLQACTAHGCLLKSDLAEPAITANYSRLGELTLENCDNAWLLKGAACCMPDEFHAVSMVWGPLESLAQRSSLPLADDSLGLVASWSVLIWRMLEEISRVHHKKVIKQPTTGPLVGVGRLVRDLAMTLAPSRNGMLSLIESLRENAHVRAARRFLDRVQRQESENRTALSMLPLNDLSERLVTAAPQAETRTRYGGLAFGDLLEQAVAEFAVREELAPLGAGTDVVTRWIRQKVFRTLQSRDRAGRDFRFIDRKEVQQARKFLQTLMHARDLVAEHELDWRTYVALRDTELIGTSIPGMRGYYRRSAIEKLMTRLEFMSAPAEVGVRLRWPLFCEATLYAAEQRATFAAFVRAAMCGEFSIYRDLSRPGLAAFSVGVDGIAWLASSRRSFFWKRKGKRGQAQPDLFEAMDGQSVGNAEAEAPLGEVCIAS